MAVNKNNVRIQLTFTKKQADWLRKCAKKCNLQISEFVKWLIDKNLGRYFAKLNSFDKEIINSIQEEQIGMSQEEQDALFADLGDPIKEEDDEEIPF